MADNELLCFDKLFAGELLTLGPLPESRALGDWARAIVADEWGECPQAMEAEPFREALTRARARVGGEVGRQMVQRCLQSLGLPSKGLLLDTLRLRAIPPGLESVPEAAPAFYAHRDTWYANPRAQVNGWLPLVPVDGHNSFRFYLDDFERAIANDSETFEAGDFEARGGFGRTSGDPKSAYPKALELKVGRTWDVALKPDTLLFFSAGHLHGTLPNSSNLVRFSLDFRFLRSADLEAGRGAPDPDNRSRGDVSKSYYRCDR